jgi:FeS assembly SUF system protein
MYLSRLFRKKQEAPAPRVEAAEAAAPGAPEPQPAAPRAAQPSDRPAQPGEIEQGVIEVLRTVYDPEIPVNIYELGLVYAVDVDASGKVVIRMTLTSPGCPVAGSLPYEVETKARGVPGVTDAHVDLVWDPPWDPDKMTEAAKLQLGIF